jgi:thiamine-phosphate pyrophosphorylase
MMVTDRRRLTRALRLPVSAWRHVLAEQIRGAVAGGADLIQIREADLEDAALGQFLHDLFRITPQCLDRVVINDRVDVALAVGAAGVHLPERGLSVAAARRLAPRPGWLVGRSVHEEAGARTSRDASYLVAGPVNATPSKPEETRILGMEGLRRIVAAAGGTPVVGIGGLTLESVTGLVRSGACGLAAIGLFVPDSDRSLAEFVQERVAAVRLMFDSLVGAPYTRGAGRPTE